MNEDKLELVQEIAERQDCISKYRAEITHLEKQLEEQLEQKDFHIQFKDTIIKDLRRECKKVHIWFAYCIVKVLAQPTSIDT